MRAGTLQALVLAALALTACSRSAGPAPNTKICFDFKQPHTAAAGMPEAAVAVDDCVRRWAYSLAASRDDAAAVGEAVAAACASKLTRWNQDALAQPDGDAESASLTTGQTTTPLQEHNVFMHQRALFYVVQARAGNCPAPPAKDGAPEGVS